MKDVCSLGIAKKLKEAGWPQAIYQPINRFSHRNNTHFYVPYSGDCEIWPLVRREDWKEALKDNSIDGFIAAPTIGELLEALPFGAQLQKEDGLEGDIYTVLLDEDEMWRKEESANPADALALLWMALKEKGIV